MEKIQLPRRIRVLREGLKPAFATICTNFVTCKPWPLVMLALATFLTVAQPATSLAQGTTNTQGSGDSSESGGSENDEQPLDAMAILGAPPQPANLMGLTPAEVRGLFGDPTRIDDVPPALSWHFAETDCVLDLIFYEAVTTRNLRVLTYDVTSTSEADDADASCLQQLLSGNG